MAEAKKKAITPKQQAKAEGFTTLSKTTITTMQNSKGVKRVIKETTTAPKAKKATAPRVQKAPNVKEGGKKNGKKQ